MRQHMTNTSCTTAVMVPVFKRPKTVLRTLDSILAQTRLPDVLVIVDDGSPDEGATVQSVKKWIEEKAPSFKTMLIEHPQNRGLASTRNTGMEAVKDYELIAFLDSDDLWPPDFLARAVPALAAQPNAVAATCDRQRIRADGSRRKLDSEEGIAGNATPWIMRHPGIVSSSIFRTKILLEEGGYNEKNDCTEDTEMFMPVSLHGPWIYLPGEPAIIDRQVAGEMGEEVNISRKLQDSFYQWVITIEKIYRTHDCSKNISHWRAHQIFTLLWLCSAHQFLKQGKMIRTVRCLWFALLRFLKGIFGRRRS